ncbi:MAG: hypothetical protein AAGB06_06455 [Verrucomicrobiota bacterium]
MPEFDKESEMAPDTDKEAAPQMLEEAESTKLNQSEATETATEEGPAASAETDKEDTEVAWEMAPSETREETPIAASSKPKAPVRRGRRGRGFKGVSTTKSNESTPTAAMIEVAAGSVKDDAIAQRVALLGDAVKETSSPDEGNTYDRTRRSDSGESRPSRGEKSGRERPRRDSSRPRKARESSAEVSNESSPISESASKKPRDRFVSRAKDGRRLAEKPNSRAKGGKKPPAEPVRMDFTQKPKSEGFIASIKSAIGKIFGGSAAEPAKKDSARPRGGNEKGSGPRSGNRNSRSRGKGGNGPHSSNSKPKGEGGRPRNGNGRRRAPRKRSGNRREGSSQQRPKSEVES